MNECLYEDAKAVAEAALPEIIEQEKVELRRFEESRAKDKATFQFRCERFGDFLAVFIERHVVKSVSAISLANSKQITIQEGFAPKLAEYKCFFWGPSFDSKNKMGEVRVMGPMPQTSGYESYYKRVRIDQKLESAHPGKDDLIVFNSETSIAVPFGLGPEVYFKVLQAIAKGFEPFTKRAK